MKPTPLRRHVPCANTKQAINGGGRPTPSDRLKDLVAFDRLQVRRSLDVPGGGIGPVDPMHRLELAPHEFEHRSRLFRAKGLRELDETFFEKSG